MSESKGTILPHDCQLGLVVSTPTRLQAFDLCIVGWRIKRAQVDLGDGTYTAVFGEKVRILLINGPNLNALGKRDTTIYGSKTLSEIEADVIAGGKELETEILCFQSNSEGSIVDYIQKQTSEAHGIIINGGALSHYGLSLRDALVDTGLPVIEVHLSNIHAREPWRHRSVTGSVAIGVIAGLGWRGYLYALDYLVQHLMYGSK